MTTAMLIRLLLFALAIALPIVGVQIATFFMLRYYGTALVQSFQQISQLVSSQAAQTIEVSRLLESTSANLLMVADRLGPSGSA